MDDFLPEFTRGLNIVLTVAFAVIGLCVLFVMSRRTGSLARADRFSMRVMLPYGSDRTREAVAQSIRQRTIATGCAILAGAALSAVLLFTPLATNPLFVFFSLLTPLVAGSVIGTTVVAVRERLFHPAPDAPRIARVHAMRVADYLDPVRRAIPWVIAGGAAVAVAVLGISALRDPTGLDPAAATAAGVFSIVALGALLALPWLERLILSQPQPATDTLELAWDDALRASAIIALRLSCALAAWFALSLSIAALWLATGSTWSGFAYQLPTWGMIALQFVYPNTGKLLPASLYPDWLLRPAPAGGAA